MNTTTTPMVRKITGAYYTPAGVVDYLVERTVGRLLDGSVPTAERPIRILDPACGEGAFLLGAYRFLLDWHRARYLGDDPERHPRCLWRDPAGEWRLSVREKARILRRSIFGVDIDPHAVETTRLALRSKMLEEEGPERNAARGLRLDLARNLRCGNALLGSDFCAIAGARGQRNAFDWVTEFPDVFCGVRPGFDAVLGNPPYLSYSGRQAIELSEHERAHFRRHYSAEGWFTAHGMFIEAAVKRWTSRFVAFIVPDQVGHLAGYGPVRRIITRYSNLAEVRYWGEQVFPGAMTPALTFIADRQHDGATTIIQADGRDTRVVCTADWPWTSLDAPALLDRLRTKVVSLGKLVADPGVHSGNCAAGLILAESKATADCVPVLEGKQVGRYRCDCPRKVLRRDYQPKTGEYFAIRPQSRYVAARFVIRQTAAYPIVGPRQHADYFRNSLLALYAPPDGTDVRYLVGLLNSRLLRFVYQQTVPESRQRAFPQVKLRTLRELPIRMPDLADAGERARHDRLVALVERMLELQRRLAVADGSEQPGLTRRVSATDRRIDHLVHEIYELTAEEIRQVEDATRSRSPSPRRQCSSCGRPRPA